MFSKFTEDAQKILIMAKKEMQELKHPYVSSEHLLLSILHYANKDFLDFLNTYHLNYDDFKKKLIEVIGIGTKESDWFLYTPLLKKIIENAILDSKDDSSDVTVERLFIALLEEGEGVANRVMMSMNIDLDSLYDQFCVKFIHERGDRQVKLAIDEFADDFTEDAKKGYFDPVIGRDNEICQMIEILLRRKKNNPLLIGDAGVGKTALVEELARRIVLGIVPNELKNMRVLSVSISSLVAGTKYRGEFEDRINKIIQELEGVSNIILFLDEIHTIIGAGGAEGAIDASNILKPYLARGKIKVIGATTKAEYMKYLENDKAFDRRFQKIIVEEASMEQVRNILLHLKDIYENYHGIVLSPEILYAIADLSDRYIPLGKQPDKAIDLLDQACSRVVSTTSVADKKFQELQLELTNLVEEKNQLIIKHDFKKASLLRKKENDLQTKMNRLSLEKESSSKRVLTLDDVYDVIYTKTKIPIKQILNMNIESLQKTLSKVVFGQDQIIYDFLKSVISSKKKNLPSGYLFVGKSGLGKTLLVREYAKLLYPKDAFIKLDMSEYRESSTVSKIIGSPPGYVGYQDKNSLLDKIKLHPYSLLLLDEVEKAHSSILKLFLQVFDDGVMTTSYGEAVSFRHTLIIMTSNLGANKNTIGFLNQKETFIRNDLKKFFGVELLNRLDGVFYFLPFSSKDIEKIISSKVNQKYPDLSSLEKKKLICNIKEQCQYEEYGARKIDKILEQMDLNTVYK